MEVLNECDFKGSQLETELRNCNKEQFEFIKTHSRIALEKQPKSKFWKDAVEVVKKHKFYKNAI